MKPNKKRKESIVKRKNHNLDTICSKIEVLFLVEHMLQNPNFAPYYKILPLNCRPG